MDNRGDRGQYGKFNREQDGHTGFQRFPRDDRRRGFRSEPYQNRNQQRGGYDRRNNRRDNNDREEEYESSLRNLLIRVGESSTPLEVQIEGLAGALERDLASYTETIIDTIFKCVRSLPSKTTVYATLVGLLNSNNGEFGKEFISRTAKALQDLMNQQLYDDVRLVLRFAADLVNSHVLQSKSFLQVLNAISPHPTTLDNSLESAAERRKLDLLASFILSTLPWCYKENWEDGQQTIGNLWASLELFMSNRANKLNPILKVFSDSDEESLVQMWKDFNSWYKSGSDSVLLPRPYLPLISRLNTGTAHLLDTIRVPAVSEMDHSKIPHTSHAVFRIFDSNHEMNQSFPPFERIILQQHILDTVRAFSNNHREASKNILNLSSDPNFSYLVIETLLSQLLSLPKSNVRQVYSNTLFLDLCKTNPVYQSTLTTAINLLFERLDTMDSECIQRLATWFALYLTNTDLKWDWAPWITAAQGSEESAKLFFVKEVIEHCVRLLYQERVKKTLPEELHALLPEKPAPVFKFNEEGNPLHAESALLMNKFRAKESHETVQQALNEEPFAKLSLEEKIELVVHSVLQLGSKSFSHLLASLERYVPLLHTLVTPDHRLLVLQTASGIWNKSPQNITIIIERLLLSRLIDGGSVVNWLFLNPQNFTRAYVWDILRITIQKALGKADIAKEELKNAQEALLKVPVAERNDDIPEVKRVNDRVESVEAVQRELKEFFIVTFQRFLMTLSEHLHDSETKKQDPNTFWFVTTLGHLKEIGRKYHAELIPFMSSLETLLFSNLDPMLHEAFTQIRSL